MTTNFIGGILIFADFIEVFKHDDMVNYAQIVEYTSSWNKINSIFYLYFSYFNRTFVPGNLLLTKSKLKNLGQL